MSRTSTVSCAGPRSPICRQRVPPSPGIPVTSESTSLSPMYRLFFVTHVSGPYRYPRLVCSLAFLDLPSGPGLKLPPPPSVAFPDHPLLVVGRGWSGNARQERSLMVLGFGPARKLADAQAFPRGLPAEELAVKMTTNLTLGGAGDDVRKRVRCAAGLSARHSNCSKSKVDYEEVSTLLDRRRSIQWTKDVGPSDDRGPYRSIKSTLST